MPSGVLRWLLHVTGFQLQPPNVCLRPGSGLSPGCKLRGPFINHPRAVVAWACPLKNMYFLGWHFERRVQSFLQTLILGLPPLHPHFLAAALALLLPAAWNVLFASLSPFLSLRMWLKSPQVSDSFAAAQWRIVFCIHPSKTQDSLPLTPTHCFP